MASGQPKAQQNLEAFEVWQATQIDDDFKQITFKGQLNRIEVAKGVGCGKSTLNQNPALRKALKVLENNLRDKGVLPPLTESAKEDAKNTNNTTTQRIVSCSTLNMYLP